ncbi:MAG: hypothetical protein AAF703_19525 [Cyanobacteria bacterium P01_D01_bin.105]
MHQLSPFTCRRLSQLPRLTSVWECDRRPLMATGHKGSTLESGSAEMAQGDCIIWADGLQGIVRGLSVVPQDTGNEAIVRTLLQAIEAPQGGVEPARPRKVVVRDREIQFFLRGALQDLDIPVEHAPTLPTIDDVFEQLQTSKAPEAELPEAFEATLLEKAALLWQAAPWRYLSEQEILAIELNCWELDTLYLSILGIAGMEYGLLFYRDLDSLQQFRHKLLNSQEFSDGMQQAFLEQNCLFINFNPTEESKIIALSSARGLSAAEPAKGDPLTAVGYEFGSLHPLEGLRSQLAAEEAASLIVVLEALHRFCKKHDLGAEDFALKPISSRFRIANPEALNRTEKKTSAANKKRSSDKITVKISTVPDVSAAFLEETLETSPPPNLAPLIDDSVPDGSLIMLGSHSEAKLVPLRQHPRIYYQGLMDESIKRPGPKANWPVLTIQTTRPKARTLLNRIQSEGGIQSICFNSGSDPISGQVFKIGILQTVQGYLHLFNEYEIDNPTDSRSLEKWEQGRAKNGSCCGLIIATGATGLQRGRPTLKEVIAFFEMLAQHPEDLGLTPLIMSYLPE